MVAIAEMLDYEETESMLVTVKATDGGSPALSSTCLLNLTIFDLNDNAPVFAEDAYITAISEAAKPGTSIAKVRNYIFI